jgi:hypothetical protein
VWSNAQPVRPFPCGTPELGQISTLEVSKSAVHHLQAVRGSGRTEIRSLDQSGRKTPHGAIPGHTRADDSPAEHHDVKAPVGKFLHEAFHFACSLPVDEDRQNAHRAPALEDFRGSASIRI